jgi:hypothetical protein
MDDKRIFFLRHAEARRGVAAFAAAAPEGWRVTFEPPKRGLDINAALHATLGEIAERCEWAGRKWPLEVWKRLLVAAWSRVHKEPVMLVPALDGNGVDIVMIRTSTMTQADMRDLLGFIDAWKAERPEFQSDEVPA